MRLAFIFNYPLVDNVQWKKQVIQECLDLGHDIDVYYGKTFILEYIKTYLIKRKFGNTSAVSNGLAVKTKKNVTFLKNLKVPVHKVKNYNSNAAIIKIKNKNYDFIIAAVDQILSKKFVSGVNSKILNIHYATLPGIKGMNAIEWNYLVNKNCELTLHYINAGIDTGSIIKKEEINFSMNDDFFLMRQKLQSKIPGTLINFLKNPNQPTYKNEGGALYTYMHKDLQNIIN